MPVPQPLRRAKALLGNALVVDVRRGVGGVLVVDTIMDSPGPLRPGRYHLLDVEEYKSLVGRILATERSLLMAKARKRSGRKSSRRAP